MISLIASQAGRESSGHLALASQPYEMRPNTIPLLRISTPLGHDQCSRRTSEATNNRWPVRMGLHHLLTKTSNLHVHVWQLCVDYACSSTALIIMIRDTCNTLIERIRKARNCHERKSAGAQSHGREPHQRCCHMASAIMDFIATFTYIYQSTHIRILPYPSVSSHCIMHSAAS